MDNPWKIVSIVFIVLCAVLVVVTLAGGFSQVAGSSLFSKSAGPDASAQSAVSFIRTNLIGQGETISLNNVTEESGVYRISTEYTSAEGSQTIYVYMTKDGKLLFPTAYSLTSSGNSGTTVTPVATAASVTSTAKTCADIQKQETPVMEAFVVSYCPYGRQMQSVLVNLSETVPTLAAHIKVRYIGEITNGTVQSMHGPTEAAENLRQICIREEQPDRYWKYVSCFLNASSSDACVKSSGVDATKLSGCTSDATRGLRYAQADFSLSDSYGVQGSPTLILNGVTVSEFDFGGRTPEAVKSLLCCGFTTQPGACATTLSGTPGGTQGTCG
jgi:hypothetical protein